MAPRKNSQQRGDCGSVVICLSAEVKPSNGNVAVNVLKSEPITDAEQAVKKVETSREEVYRDPVSKTLENGSSDSTANVADSSCCEIKAGLRSVDPEQEAGINGGSCTATENDSDKGEENVRNLAGMKNVRQIDEIRGNLIDCRSEESGSVVRKKSEIEVERELVNCEEGICKSSNGALESISQKKTAIEAEKEAFVQEQVSSKLPMEEKISTKISEPSHADESTNTTHDRKYSRLTNTSQELISGNEKSVCDFDLNQEVHVEDMDELENQISTPIAVLSASMPATIAEIQDDTSVHEGSLTLKGSASTSAFYRTPSLHYVPDVDMCHFLGECSNSSKQQDDSLNIDLNMNINSNEKTLDPLSLSSGQCGDEASQRKSVKLELDLNCVTDDGDETSYWLADAKLHNRSPSSSSSSKQHSYRNINLNDQPFSAVDLDLNTGLVLDGGGDQFTEEDRLMLPPTDSVAGMKRTEPDSGLEQDHLYPFKRHQSTWN